MLESLNYSFRNPKNIISVIYRIKQLRNYKKTMGSSEDPSLVNNVDELGYGILRVKMNGYSWMSNCFTAFVHWDCTDRWSWRHRTARASWAARCLTDGNKHPRFETDITHLLRLEQGDEFLESIVTGGDTHVHRVTSQVTHMCTMSLVRWHTCAPCH